MAALLGQASQRQDRAGGPAASTDRVPTLEQSALLHMDQVPTGAQNFLEWLIESLYGFLEGILGSHLVARTFWFFGTIFIFILAANWISLVPGVGTIGWGQQTDHGFVIDQPLFRGANADLNMTLAMALIFFALWIIWAIQEVGVRGVLKELFAPKGETAGAMKLLMGVVFLAAGLLEIVSILFRPVSLSFRLYGNIFAGEQMLETMAACRCSPASASGPARATISTGRCRRRASSISRTSGRRRSRWSMDR